MGSKDEDKNSKKPINSYCLLQMKMSEVVRSKKPKEGQSSGVSKSSASQSSSVSKSSPSSSKSNFSSKSASDKDPKKYPPCWKGQQSGSASDKTQKIKEMPPGQGNKNLDPNIPNRLYGDYYCEICDSHMNSEGMWEAHITGKRHIKNIKKGDPDSKYEDLDVESNVKHEIRNVKDPIVGLSYIHEIRRKEAGIPSLYTCFLCQATFASVPMVIEHVITLKHRLNYMKENSPNDYELLNAVNLKKGQMEPLAAEIALKLEQKYGRGSVKVKQERNKQLSFPPTKRAFDSDDDDDDMPRKIKKFNETNPYVWKAVDCPKANLKDVRDCREIIEERRKHAYSSDEEADMYKQDYYTKRAYGTKRPFDDNHPDSYKSLTPSLRETSKREVIYSRTRTQASSEGRYSRTHTQASPEDRYSRTHTQASSEERYSRTHTQAPPVERYSRTHIQALPEEHYSQPRSYQTQEKNFESSKEYPLPSETEVQQPLSGSQVLKDFVQKVYALPTEIFLKIVLLKLENIEVKGIDELELLSKVINKSQTVLCNKLPPDVQAVLKQRISQQSENSIPKSFAPSVITQGNANSFTTETNFKSPGSDFNFIKDILNRAKENADSIPLASHNITPHQASQQNSQQIASYPGLIYGNIDSSFQRSNITASNDNYSYNSAVASSSSGIPGLTLTDENRDYSTYQPYYSDHSSGYPLYRN